MTRSFLLDAPRKCSLFAITAALVLGAAACRAESPAPDAKAFTEKVPETSITFDMVPVPAGKYKMGSPASEKKRKDDEGPQVEVQVDPFFIGKYEVTWGEYNDFLQNYQRLGAKAPVIPADKMADAVTYPTPMYELEAGPILDRMGRGPKNPAVIMSQLAAKQYTKYLSKKTGRFYRLPTEAEWEYACRAGTTTAYSSGDDAKGLDENAWTFDNSSTKASPDGAYHEVGGKKPNAWGIYDMHGNVAEWTIDAYDPEWYGKLAAKANGGTISWHDAINWPTKQYPRAIRGGSWQSEAEECRSASRFGTKASLNVKDPQLPKSPHWLTEGFWIGFRLVAPLKEPSEDEKRKFWEADDDYTKRVLTRDREIRELVDGPKK